MVLAFGFFWDEWLRGHFSGYYFGHGDAAGGISGSDDGVPCFGAWRMVERQVLPEGWPLSKRWVQLRFFA